jgi:O-antigen/teichoic acid export membrane protein
MTESLKRLLIWSEKYTKTDMLYLFKGGFWLTLGQIGNGLAAFILSIAFARLVPKEVYGTYRFLLSLFWILTAFSFTGLTTALVRAVAKGEEGAFRQAWRLSLLGSIPLAVISLGLATYYFLHGNSILGWGSILIAILGPLFQMTYLYGAYLEGKKEFQRMGLFALILSLVPTLSLLVVMPFTQNPLLFFAIYLGINALTAFCLSIWIFRIYKPNRTPSDGLANIGGHFSIMYILATIGSQIDQLFVFHYLGPAQLAVYSFATAMPDQARSIFGTLENLALPKFTRRPMEDIQKTFIYRLLNFTGIALLASIIYIVMAPLLFQIFFPKYLDAIPYSQLYALGLIAVSNILPPVVLEAHAAKRELYIYNIFSPLFQIAALFFGILFWGFLGVIIARILGKFFNLILGMMLVHIFGQRTKSA